MVTHNLGGLVIKIASEPTRVFLHNTEKVSNSKGQLTIPISLVVEQSCNNHDIIVELYSANNHDSGATVNNDNNS